MLRPYVVTVREDEIYLKAGNAAEPGVRQERERQTDRMGKRDNLDKAGKGTDERAVKK